MRQLKYILEPEPQLEEQQCRVCDAFRRIFVGNDLRIDLGLLDHVLETECAAHDRLLQWIRKDYSNRIQASGITGGPYNIVVIATDGIAQARVKLSCMLGQLRPGLYWDLLLASPCEEENKPGYGRSFNQDWVDLGLIKRWMSTCTQQHGSKCQNPLKVPRVSPTWLIDTFNECLVPGHESLDYVAISYRWGTSAGFQTDIQALGEFKIPGGLSESPHARYIPPTIRHSIQLVRTLGERYLWADAICLVQGDDEYMARELQMMGAIYASAKITLVATDGDALDGIHGLENISQSRRSPQHIFPWMGGDRIIIRQQPVLQHGPGCSPYFDRGWTFQELLFSKRRLIFANNQAHWKCACASWHEDQIETENDVTTSTRDVLPVIKDTISGEELASHQSYFRLGEINLKKLGMVLSEYNNRQLTFPEDALPGVTGLLTLLSRSFEKGFLCGLPEMCFDAALMWDTFSIQRVQRRKYSGRKKSVLPGSQLPSWSWVGWKFARLRMADEEALGVFTLLPKPLTTPITQWYSHDAPESGLKRAIQPSWLQFRERMKDPDVGLPDGWHKEAYERNSHGQNFEQQPGFLGKHVYWHNSDPEKYYWCPVPWVTFDEDRIPYMPPQYPYISCQTKRGWFGAAMSSNSDIMTAERQWQVRIYDRVKIVDGFGKLCGWLQLFMDEEPSYFPDARSGITRNLELAAVCLQHWPTSKPWKDEDDHSRDDHAFYGVFWVEWSNGVAYRKGSGFVAKQKWEEHDLEEVLLVLG